MSARDSSPACMLDEWEGAAQVLLDEAHAHPPVNIFALARALGFSVRPWSNTGALLDTVRRRIFIDAGARRSRQQGLVAHELGHVALERAGLAQDERGATYVGGCLRLPRQEFSRDVRRTEWSIGELQKLHPDASALAIAVRITQLREAVATVIDPVGRVAPWRIGGLCAGPAILEFITCAEDELAAQAWHTRVECRSSFGLIVATPLPDPDRGHDRVVVVASLDDITPSFYSSSGRSFATLP